MLQPEQHHQWLHTSFIVSNARAKSDAIPATSGSNLRGRRVWCKRPIFDGERDKSQATDAHARQSVPADTGGTVAFHDQVGDITVRWDNGHISMHHKDDLLRLAFLIGLHKTLKDHSDCLANRCQCGAKKRP